MPSQTLFLLLDVVGIAVAVVLLRRWFKRSGATDLPLPPGPKGMPIIGNLLDMPPHHEWLQFTEWGDKFGDLVYLRLLSQPVLILNTASHATALLHKKSSIYSDRPSFIMAGELIGWKRTLGLTPYGERFREYRRFIHRLIGGKEQMRRFHSLEYEETKRFVGRVLRRPEGLAGHIRKTAGAIILRLSHGYTVHPSGSDAIVDLVDLATEQFSLATSPGAYLVDVFPLLRYVPRWVPGARFQRTAREWRDTLEEMAEVPHAMVKRNMRENRNVPNYTSELLENEKMSAQKEFNIKWSAASLYSGGADTTVSAIRTFFLAMSLHPSAQQRAQAELDAVVGPDRLPTFEDREQLPYVDAIVKEVCRWGPVVPLGIPHRLQEEDVHEGYRIPKGTIVIPNIWKMLHDPTTYTDPFTFEPARFLPSSSGSNKNNAQGEPGIMDPRDVCFGFGRRICPGLHLADASLFITIAMTLATLDVSDPVGADGRPLGGQVGYTSGTISHPEEFACTIKPRSAKAEALVFADAEEA
ncbi:cytochrome P450 [Trametopsis cervina]|nr:cytochrome P450 [Trametopsis cervina]